eukprot:8158-Heterococcus_DN1.PRE.6
MAKGSALAKTDVLGVVFGFVGAGHSFFVATVCKRWRNLYHRVHKRKCTTHSSVYESMARVLWARGGGLPLPFFERLKQVPRELNDIEEFLCFTAGKYADTPMLYELHKYGMPWEIAVLAGCAASGSLEKLQCAHRLGKAGFYWSSLALLGALNFAIKRGGTVETMQWLYEKAGGRIHDCMRQLAVDAALTPELRAFVQRVVTEHDAACNGGVALVQLELVCAQKNIELAPYTVTHMRLAAEQGHQEMCMFLRSQQCPWDESVCEAATATDCPVTLRWLHEHGCPWDLERVCFAAASKGKVLVLKYLLHTVKVPISDLRRAASQRGSVSPKSLRWLYDESQRSEDEMEVAADDHGASSNANAGPGEDDSSAGESSDGDDSSASESSDEDAEVDNDDGSDNDNGSDNEMPDDDEKCTIRALLLLRLSVFGAQVSTEGYKTTTQKTLRAPTAADSLFNAVAWHHMLSGAFNDSVLPRELLYSEPYSYNSTATTTAIISQLLPSNQSISIAANRRLTRRFNGRTTVTLSTAAACCSTTAYHHLRTANYCYYCYCITAQLHAPLCILLAPCAVLVVALSCSTNHHCANTHTHCLLVACVLALLRANAPLATTTRANSMRYYCCTLSSTGYHILHTTATTPAVTL